MARHLSAFGVLQSGTQFECGLVLGLYNDCNKRNSAPHGRPHHPGQSPQIVLGYFGLCCDAQLRFDRNLDR
jgi:hypothetical protein